MAIEPTIAGIDAGALESLVEPAIELCQQLPEELQQAPELPDVDLETSTILRIDYCEASCVIKGWHYYS